MKQNWLSLLCIPVLLLGLLTGAALCHNFGLAASAAGPTQNGKIAVVIGIAVVTTLVWLLVGREIGYVLHRDFWGKGMMTEAAAAVRDFARTIPGLRLLYAHCDSRNKGSSKVMEHIGMSLAATGARRNRNSTELSAEYCYTLLLPDC